MGEALCHRSIGPLVASSGLLTSVTASAAVAQFNHASASTLARHEFALHRNSDLVRSLRMIATSFGFLHLVFLRMHPVWAALLRSWKHFGTNSACMTTQWSVRIRGWSSLHMCRIARPLSGQCQECVVP